ncbi:MAG: hypothetical protein E7167_01745 [Firmicutes bacterium]|nr:hypothetical protein [Bacillota bacterium]
MSFYGNITNVTKTNFAFDRIYANRVEMETHMAEDEVYIGRFVLVDYDANNEFVKEAYYDKDEYIITEVGDVFYYLFSDPELNFKIAFNSEGIILDQNNLITGMNKNDLCYIENVVELNNG